MKRALLLILLALLTACGGGGSGGGGQNTPAPPDDPAPAPDPVPPPPAGPTFTVSGEVTVSRNLSVDSDTNNLENAYAPNDDLTSAQLVNNPTTLGGYVNQPGSGASGRSQIPGDIDDFFRVDLLAGQTVVMLVAEFETADADLYLYDSNGEIVDFSIESGEVESIVAPGDGTYSLNISAFEGATNYILAVGTQEATAAYSRQHYIEPWQAVISYESGYDRGTVIPAELGFKIRGGGAGRPWLVELDQAIPDRRFLLQRLGSASDRKGQFASAELESRFETLMTIKRLGRQAGVALAEPNYRVNNFYQPDDEALPFQWHYPLIDLPAAWDSTVGSESVTVAVIDTGILSGHPDLRGQLVAGYDFVRDRGSAGDGDGLDPNPEDEGNIRSPGPSSYHGTHVAGTIAAAGDNAIGVAGVAYGTRIMPLRALGDGGAGTTYDVRQAVRYAAGLANDSGTVPERAADIINLSLGGGPFSSIDQQLFEQLSARGIIVVAAAGNEATTAPQYPASYDGVLSVSAVDINRALTPYSNRGRSIDLAAPGGNNGADFNGDGYPDGVLSTGGVGEPNPDFAYTFLSGTSMAAPHVAGVIALMRSVNPQLTAGDVEVLLRSGALTDDVGTPGQDEETGYGIINAYKSVLSALEAVGTDLVDTPRLGSSATTLSFGSSEQPLELELSNAGQGDLAITSITVSEPWLRVRSLSINDSGLGSYQVTVNRAGLIDGIYSANVIITSTANTMVVRVFMSVGSPGGEADVGTVYILLYDTAEDAPVAEFPARVVDGRYSFRFTEVPEGEYELFAGSDVDNDLFICDAGEACGAWLTLDQPIRIILNGNQLNLDFPLEYQVFLPELSATARNPGEGVIRPQRRLPGRYQSADPGLARESK